MNPMRAADIEGSDPMNETGISIPDRSIPAEFQACLTAQRAAFLKAPEPSYAERVAGARAPPYRKPECHRRFDTFSKLRPMFQPGFMCAVRTFMLPPYTRFSCRIVDSWCG